MIVFGYELSAQFFDVILSEPVHRAIALESLRKDQRQHPLATPAAVARDDESERRSFADWLSTAVRSSSQPPRW
jgi:hypothetical protein